MNTEQFTAKEAMRLLGKDVNSICELSGVPAGTRGRVFQIRGGSGFGNSGFSVAVKWDCSGPRTQDEFNKTFFHRFLSTSGQTDIE